MLCGYLDFLHFVLQVYNSSTTLFKELDYLGWCQGDCLADSFAKIRDVMEFVNKTNCPAGATVTISNVTVAFWIMGGLRCQLCFDVEPFLDIIIHCDTHNLPWCMTGNNASPLLFDSHSQNYGDGKENGASLFTFLDVDQLMLFLMERFPQVNQQIPRSSLYL